MLPPSWGAEQLTAVLALLYVQRHTRIGWASDHQQKAEREQHRQPDASAFYRNEPLRQYRNPLHDRFKKGLVQTITRICLARNDRMFLGNVLGRADDDVYPEGPQAQ